MRVWSAATLLTVQTGVAVITYSCTWEIPYPDQHHRLDWVVCGFLQVLPRQLRRRRLSYGRLL